MPRETWKDTNYVKIYRLAQSGLSDRKIARALGISMSGFMLWKTRKPAVKDALRQARAADNKASTFNDYVFDRLPAHLQVLWKRIKACDDMDNAKERCEALLSEAGKNARQNIFLYALTSSNFNASEACRRANINRKTMENWIRYDPDFVELMDEIKFHKKNFLETALLQLAKEGDTHAIIFGNRTLNADRGYGEKVEHQVSGDINVNVNVVPIEQLSLPIETRREILDAIRAAKEKDELRTIDAKNLALPRQAS